MCWLNLNQPKRCYISEERAGGGEHKGIYFAFRTYRLDLLLALMQDEN